MVFECAENHSIHIRYAYDCIMYAALAPIYI